MSLLTSAVDRPSRAHDEQAPMVQCKPNGSPAGAVLTSTSMLPGWVEFRSSGCDMHNTGDGLHTLVSTHVHLSRSCPASGTTWHDCLSWWCHVEACTGARQAATGRAKGHVSTTMPHATVARSSLQQRHVHRSARNSWTGRQLMLMRQLAAKSC